MIERLQTMPISSGQCAYSAVTRMELLGFPQMSLAEEQLIKDTLSQLHYLPINRSIEDRAIQIRRTRRAKLPDALIAATAVEHGLELLTQDMGLQATFVASRTGLSNR